MAVKMPQSFRLDVQIADEFKAVCKRNKKTYSKVMEEMMKEYIARSEQGLVDELYAPLISRAVKKAMDDQVDRIIAILNGIQIDNNAILHSVPVLYQKNMQILEHTLNKFVNEELLNPHRDFASKRFEMDNHGRAMLEDLRSRSAKDLQNRRRLKYEEKLQKEKEKQSVALN